jgi:endonuclease-3
MRCGKKQCYLESLWTFRYNKDIASEKTLKSGEKKGVTMDIIAKISEELGIRKNQAEAAVKLIDEGNTIPFIARYRKEATGALNDEVLRNLYERLTYLRNLEERKETVLAGIEEQGKLTDELKAQIMSAETMVVVEDLYAKYPDIDALANATPEEIEEIVRPCGLGKSKARDINACMRMLRDEYHSQVPDDFNALLKLPGVGRKSANLIMGDVFKKPAIVTDTHCIRLCNRIGLVHDCKDPKKVEMALWKIVPPEEGSSLCHRFVEHGREVCTARTTPHCERCVLADICEKNGVEK